MKKLLAIFLICSSAQADNSWYQTGGVWQHNWKWLTESLTTPDITWTNPYASSLRGMWVYNEEMGMVTNTASGQPNGQMSFTSPETFLINGAVSFDGVGSVVINAIIPTNTAKTTTILAWFNLDSLARTNMIMGSLAQSDYRCYMGVIPTNGNSYFGGGAGDRSEGVGGLRGTTALDSNTWYHGAITMSNGWAVVYLNGIQEVWTNYNNPISERPIYVGNRYDYSQSGPHPSYYFDGLISNACMYHRILTSNEIYQLSQNQSVSTDELKLCYPLNQKTWTRYKDYSVNTNLLNNFPSFAARPLWAQSDVNINGRSVRYLQLNGTTHGMVSTNMNATVSKELTVTLWLWQDATNAIRYVLNEGSGTAQGWYMRLNADGKMLFYISENGLTDAGDRQYVTSDVDMTITNDWQHYGITFKSDRNPSFKVYKNGVNVAATVTGDALTNVFMSSKQLHIGKDRSDGNLLGGRIGHLHVFTNALDDLDPLAITNMFYYTSPTTNRTGCFIGGNIELY